MKEHVPIAQRCRVLLPAEFEWHLLEGKDRDAQTQC
jgi:hypothetical protein